MADRRPRVLYLTHRVPFPPDKGDRIRNYNLLRQLSASADVDLVAVADEPVTTNVSDELARFCRSADFVPFTGLSRWFRTIRAGFCGRSLSEGAFDAPALARLLRRRVREVRYDAAVVSASSLAPFLRISGLAGVPGFVDVVDVDSRKWADYAAMTRRPMRWVYEWEANRVRKLERSLPEWAAACSLVSVPEAELFESAAGPGTATVAPNGVDLEFFAPTAAVEESACAFVGALDYRPNVDAAIWFATEVWPRLRTALPEAEFRVIGRKPVQSVLRLAELPGVRVIGQVPDVRPHVASAAVVVVPLRLARGIQNKVLEAMAMKKAVVASPPALAALDVTPGVHAEQAESAAEFAGTVLELLRDPRRRSNLGEAGLDYVRQHHDWSRCLHPLTERILTAAEPMVAGRL